MVSVQKLMNHIYRNIRHHFNLQLRSDWVRCELINVVSAYRNAIVKLHWMHVNDEVMQLSRWLNSQGISFVVSCLKVANNIAKKFFLQHILSAAVIYSITDAVLMSCLVSVLPFVAILSVALMFLLLFFPLDIHILARHHTPKLSQIIRCQIAQKVSLRKGCAWALTSVLNVFSVQKLLYFMRGACVLPLNVLCDTDGPQTGLLEPYQTHTNLHHITSQCLKHLTGIKPSTRACHDFPACFF